MTALWHYTTKAVRSRQGILFLRVAPIVVPTSLIPLYWPYPNLHIDFDFTSDASRHYKRDDLEARFTDWLAVVGYKKLKYRSTLLPQVTRRVGFRESLIHFFCRSLGPENQRTIPKMPQLDYFLKHDFVDPTGQMSSNEPSAFSQVFQNFTINIQQPQSFDELLQMHTAFYRSVLSQTDPLKQAAACDCGLRFRLRPQLQKLAAIGMMPSDEEHSKIMKVTQAYERYIRAGELVFLDQNPKKKASEKLLASPAFVEESLTPKAKRKSKKSVKPLPNEPKFTAFDFK
jgi:hypothetical protein